jgi:hypothetical protein
MIFIKNGDLYSTGKDGQPVKVLITTSFWHKSYVFLFSRIETYGFWSTHKTEDEKNQGRAHYAALFREEHYRQIKLMYEEAVREEGLILAQTASEVDDRTGESLQILKETTKNN